MDKDIVIIVEGGLIQSIRGNTQRVVVRDYDVEGTDPNRCEIDDEGCECIVSEHAPNP